MSPPGKGQDGTHSALPGILLVLAAFVLFTIMDTMAKWLTGAYSLPQIMLLNTVFGHSIVMALLLTRMGGWPAIRTRRLGLHLLRGAVAVGGGFGGYFAFSRMPMADVYAIIFAAPLMITALSAPFLGEHVGWRRWTAVVVGFSGVVLMLRPGAGVMDIGAFGALAAALAHAIAMLTVRRMGDTEAPIAFAFYTNMAAFLISGALLPFSGFVMPSLHDLALSAGCGITGALGLVCIVTGFARAPAAVVAPFQYTQMLWGMGMGYLVWGDIPDSGLFIGGGIVIASGLYIVHREARPPHPERPSLAASHPDGGEKRPPAPAAPAIDPPAPPAA